jgi:predicted RecB family nuclease
MGRKMIAVTKIIDLLDKPALVGWANKLGLSGVSLKEYYKNVTTEGNEQHYEIENYFRYGELFEGYELLENNIKGYEVIGVEQTISNQFLIGRIDLILKKDNLIYVCDFKRNKSIYLKTKLQLSAYKEMLEADKVCFINSKTFELIEINIDTSKYYTIVKRLYQIYQLLKELKEKL